MMRANVVLPVPGGPQKTSDWNRSSSIIFRSARPGPMIFCWHWKSCSVRGRIRSASGRSDDSLTTDSICRSSGSSNKLPGWLLFIVAFLNLGITGSNLEYYAAGAFVCNEQRVRVRFSRCVEFMLRQLVGSPLLLHGPANRCSQHPTNAVGGSFILALHGLEQRPPFSRIPPTQLVGFEGRPRVWVR